MKKAILSRIRTISLIGLISGSAALGMGVSILTQPTKTSVALSTPTVDDSLIWPTQGIISKGFSIYHEGIDIAGAAGTPILAAKSGTVVKAGWDDWGLGNAVELAHPDGSHTVYGHSSRLLVSPGQSVSQGSAIALMGSTGNSTAPHLHFEVHPDGRHAVNPMTELPALVAGKIPSFSASNAPLPNVIASNRAAAPINLSLASIGTSNQCSGRALIEGETANARVKVCQESGQLFYLGQSKQDPSSIVRLLARQVGDRYEADNGRYSYYINRERVEVWRDGLPLRSDRFTPISTPNF